jgi:hypothetical protein
LVSLGQARGKWALLLGREVVSLQFPRLQHATYKQAIDQDDQQWGELH